MPPHVEIDCSHHDDWQPRSLAYDDDEQPSPLFRDSESMKVSPRSSPLDRRQSDPDAGSEIVPRAADRPTGPGAFAPVVSVITAIIGPESAYVRTSPSSAVVASTTTKTTTAATKTTTTTTTTTVAALPKRPPAAPQSKPSPDRKDEGGIREDEAKPIIILRASRYVSKKGWKVVKSLPNKLGSMVGSMGMKLPCHRNVV